MSRESIKSSYLSDSVFKDEEEQRLQVKKYVQKFQDQIQEKYDKSIVN